MRMDDGDGVLWLAVAAVVVSAWGVLVFEAFALARYERVGLAALGL